MNRRKAITQLLVIGGSGVTAYTGLKTYKVFKSPSLHTLDSFEDLIGDLAETIIPKTDSPGAKEVGTGPFIVKMVKDCTSRMTQNKFISGLDGLVSYSQRHYGKSFGECTESER